MIHAYIRKQNDTQINTQTRLRPDSILSYTSNKLIILLSLLEQTPRNRLIIISLYVTLRCGNMQWSCATEWNNVVQFQNDASRVTSSASRWTALSWRSSWRRWRIVVTIIMTLLVAKRAWQRRKMRTDRKKTLLGKIRPELKPWPVRYRSNARPA